MSSAIFYDNFPTGKFKAITVDPPWTVATSRSAAAKATQFGMTYQTLTMHNIRFLPVAEIADDDCLLFLWTLAATMQEAMDVARWWGFRFTQELIWVKTRETPDGPKAAMGMGSIVRNVHESCLICVRGNVQQECKKVKSVFQGLRRNHSQKPDQFYSVVERLSKGPYCDLFARQHRPGWTCWGDELVGQNTNGSAQAAT